MTTKCEACHKRSENGDTLRFVKIDGRKYIYCLDDTETIFNFCERLVKGMHFTNPAERAHYVQFERRIFMLKANQYEKLVAFIKSL